MNDIVYTKSYEDYKAEVGTELMKTSESFVRIGYLLKVARDTDVLTGTEYEGNYIKFAEKEFGLEKTQVSRFIRINDKFSIGGNSPELQEQYQGFGTRKLGIMLTLPDEVVEELSPEHTVRDMEEITEEIKEEQKVSPLEAYAETLESENFPTKAAEVMEKSVLAGCIYQIFEDYPETFEDVYLAAEERKVRALAPVSEQTYIVRVTGYGRQMVIFHEEDVAVVNARTGEKEHFDLEKVKKVIDNIFLPYGDKMNPIEVYQSLYGKTYELQKTKEEPKRVKNGVKDAKKNESKKAEADKRTKTDEGNKSEKPVMAAATEQVPDIQPEGSAGEDSIPGEEDLGGTEGESLSSGTGEALSGEGAGTSSGEGSTDKPAGRNKYTARLENLLYSAKILGKDLEPGKENYEEALKEARNIQMCIEAIIQALEAEEKPTWREIK